MANDPNQMRALVSGSLISVTHFPHARIRTPLNVVEFAGEEFELRRRANKEDDEDFSIDFLTGPRRSSDGRLPTNKDSDFAFSTIATHP